MQSVKVPVVKLLKTLKENREIHETDFNESSEGYRISVTKALEERLQTVRDGGKIDLFFPELEEPVSHIKDYDRVISMLEMTEESHVTLSSYEFTQYVQDEWGWKEDFLATSATYKSVRR